MTIRRYQSRLTRSRRTTGARVSTNPTFWVDGALSPSGRDSALARRTEARHLIWTKPSRWRTAAPSYNRGMARGRWRAIASYEFDGGATMFDGRHDLELIEAPVSGAGGPVRRTSGPKDVGDLDGGAHPRSAAGRSRFHSGHRRSSAAVPAPTQSLVDVNVSDHHLSVWLFI